MSLPAHYLTLYAYEADCDQKMLAMLHTVPNHSRHDTRFQRAVTLAAHLAACRENWLARMTGTNAPSATWWDAGVQIDALRPRFDALHRQWTEYLSRLSEAQWAEKFIFDEGGDEQFSLPVGVQVVQLMAHAPYHRGQVALLVDALGGETTDTDYADWWWARQ